MLDALPAVAEQLEAEAARAGVPQATLLRLILVVEEVVTNAIKYGYEPGQQGVINVMLGIGQGLVELTVTDDAKPFDPTLAPTPDLHASVEDRPVGGLGLHLIRAFSDTQHYRRDAGRNVLTLTHRFSVPSA